MYYLNKHPESTGRIGISERGSLTMEGQATVFDDLVVPLTQTQKGANDKPDFDETNVGFLFPKNDVSEKLYFIVQLPHAYKEGSTIFPHVHWKQEANDNVTWKMDYKWFNVRDAVPVGWTTITIDTPISTYVSGSIHQISHLPGGVEGAGKSISSIILSKLYRDDNVYTGDAMAFQMDFHVERDTLGSAEEYHK